MASKGSETDYNTIATVLVFLVTFLLVFLKTRRQSRVPPGPALFPIVGNLPSLVTKDTLGRLGELRKQYGDVYGLYAGRKLIVFLNGYKTIHDALVKKGSLFMERAKPSIDREEVYHQKGLIFADGSIWREGKSFTLATLQEICYSEKGFLESLVNDEVKQLKEIIVKFEKPFDVERYLNSCVANIVFQVVYGHRFELNDEGLFWFQRTVREFSNEYMKREVIMNCLPVLKHLPGDILLIQKTRNRFAEVMKFLTKFIDDLKSEQSSRKCTYVESYLDRIANNKMNGVDSSLDENNLKVAAYHLIVAGMESTASTIRWILLYLIRNPHIQDKMYAEINRVLKQEPPSVADKKQLPYAQAVVLEGLRISHVAPLAMPHTVVQDTLFHGFLIPKECTVIPNLSTAMMDPLVWENPEEFRPERFLSEDETVVTVPKEFIPFSLGPRSCLGETLARLEIFLFTTGLVQKLKFLPEREGTLPGTKGELAATYNAKPFKMRTILR